MKKFFAFFLPCIVLSLSVLLSACKSHTSEPVEDRQASASDMAELDTREQKPKFLDLIPASYHLANTGEDNHIKVITNSDLMQKACMIYYDHAAKKWEILTWEGSGSKVIADLTFNKIYGVVERSGSLEDPTFYMSYSKDAGRTWLNHPIEKAALTCKGDTAQLLVSDDFDKKSGKPAIVIVLQHKALAHPVISKSLNGWDDSYLCPQMHLVKNKQ